MISNFVVRQADLQKHKKQVCTNMHFRLRDKFDEESNLSQEIDNCMSAVTAAVNDTIS
jgi:hypothetical protein